MKKLLSGLLIIAVLLGMNRYYRQDTAPADLPGLLAKASVGIAGLWERDEGPAAAPHKYDVADSPYYKFVDVYNLKSGGSLLLLEKYKTKQQETGYTCGPAAAFTVAQYFLGTVPENEKEIAKIMGTHPAGVKEPGTNTRGMSRYFEEKAGS